MYWHTKVPRPVFRETEGVVLVVGGKVMNVVFRFLCLRMEFGVNEGFV